MKINNFKELTIWQRGIILVKDIYKATENFPPAETYGLRSQMRRASISIPSNIAEGFKRQHSKEFKQYLNITLGSLAELETQTIIATELNYINTNIRESIVDSTNQLNKMTYSLYKKL